MTISMIESLNKWCCAGFKNGLKGASKNEAKQLLASSQHRLLPSSHVKQWFLLRCRENPKTGTCYIDHIYMCIM
ncbi:hypothetical protein OIU76_023358 [Salix suchowensis]|nr:hypothetical protein OIU76_023358 [Salix suchowensis]